MSHKKPIGKTGPLRISLPKDHSHPTVAFNTISFPKTKKEQEYYFLEKFVNAARLKGFAIHNYKLCSKENDFDCELIVGNHEKIFLELKELMDYSLQSHPYEYSNYLKNDYQYAQTIIHKVIEYSDKYQSDTPVHLLLYVTDWRYLPGPTTIALLQHGLLKKEILFENVFLYTPLDEEEGELITIYPTPKEYWKDFDENKYKESTSYNFNPYSWKIGTTK